MNSIIIDKNDGEKMWNDIVSSHKEKIEIVLSKMRPLYSKYLSIINLSIKSYKALGGIIMYENEINEISKILNISFSECLIFQLTYEAFSMCTSAIVDVDGVQTHVRTMDWDLPDLKDVTINIRMMKGEEHLFDAVTWAGFVGIFTGIKPNRYTISMNYRRTDNGTLFDNMKMLLTNAYPNSYLIRELLESDYCPSESIKNANIISPAYYIVMSKEFSGVIIKDRKDYKIKHAPVVQTNCDDYGIGDNILYSYERLKYMKTEFDSYDKLIEHISKFPICNNETIYIVVMNTSGILYFST
jgi:hypothetical protein